MEFAIILIVVGVIAVAVVYSSKRNKELEAAGTIIDRPISFWEREEIFYTTADFNTIVERARSGDFADTPAGVSLRSAAKAIDFDGDSWKATLKYKGFHDGEHRYTFGFTSWTQHKGTPYGVGSMNMTETSLEKLFLRADPMCAVEMRQGEFKTKTNFI